MSAVLEAVRDKPISLFSLDGNSPFLDYSGFGRTATVSGAPKSAAVTSGVSTSTVFNKNAIGRFDAPSPVFSIGYEGVPFSLEAWVYPISRVESDTATEIQILGNTGQMDGLVIKGTSVSFVTKYSSTGECRVSYDMQVLRRFHVVGIHTKEKNSLYIDGVLVGENDVTEEQKADTYASTSQYLYSGSTTATRCVAMNAVGIYGTALPPDPIMRHFLVGNNHLSPDQHSRGFNGLRIPLVQNEADIFLEQTWTTKTDWATAILTDTVVENDQIKPRFINGVSVAGTWQDLFVMSITDVTSIYGVNMTWDGEGAVIQASLDGDTWETVERSKNLDIIPPGFNPQNKELMLKISFPGGILDDPSYVDNLTVVGFKTGVNPPVHGRTVTFTAPAYIKNDYSPNEFSDDWGTRLKYGTAVINSDTITDNPVVPGTFEVWLKSNNADAFQIGTANAFVRLGPSTFSATGATIYINGKQRTSEFLPVGEWTCVHIVPTTEDAGSFYINRSSSGSVAGTSTGDITVGSVELYEDVKSTTQIKDSYTSHLGMIKVSTTEVNVTQVVEPEGAAVIVAADWSIVSAG